MSTCFISINDLISILNKLPDPVKELQIRDMRGCGFRGENLKGGSCDSRGLQIELVKKNDKGHDCCSYIVIPLEKGITAYDSYGGRGIKEV